MKRLILIIGLTAGLIFAACTTLSNPFDENDPNYIEDWDLRRGIFFDSLGLKFDTVLNDGSIKWYNDAACVDFIEPVPTNEPPMAGNGGEPNLGVTSPTRTNYRCTELPDTLWGEIKRPYPQSNEKFYCVFDICQSNDNDKKSYSIKNYRAELMASCP